jgi:hypothetical protein
VRDFWHIFRYLDARSLTSRASKRIFQEVPLLRIVAAKVMAFVDRWRSPRAEAGFRSEEYKEAAMDG